MRQSFFFGLRDEFYEVEHALDYCAFEVVPPFVAEDAGEEGEHARLL